MAVSLTVYLAGVQSRHKATELKPAQQSGEFGAFSESLQEAGIL